jgi:imidazoleglycerol-phosphate dehydratase
MKRFKSITRETNETSIKMELDLDGNGTGNISTGIPFFDHMLTLFSVHGFFNLMIKAKGDLEVDFHHTVEDTGLVLGDLLNEALGDRKGIKRYGHAITPMDETLADVSLDLSNRPFLIYNVPEINQTGSGFDIQLAGEFLRAFATRGGVTLHVNVQYGENEHHIIEAVFKSLGRALDEAVSFDKRIRDVRSSKGCI